jgi:plasmid stability protein
MPTLTVRGLPPEVYQALKDRANSHNRSMEGEAREIISSTVNSGRWWAEWVQDTERLRGQLPLPDRSMPRETPL